MASYQIILLTLILGSCAHHMDVRPGPKGVHKVIRQSDAISQANHYCDQFERDAAFEKVMAEPSSELGKFAGLVDEVMSEGHPSEMTFKCI